MSVQYHTQNVYPCRRFLRLDGLKHVLILGSFGEVAMRPQTLRTYRIRFFRNNRTRDPTGLDRAEIKIKQQQLNVPWKIVKFDNLSTIKLFWIELFYQAMDLIWVLKMGNSMCTKTCVLYGPKTQKMVQKHKELQEWLQMSYKFGKKFCHKKVQWDGRDRNWQAVPPRLLSESLSNKLTLYP